MKTRSIQTWTLLALLLFPSIVMTSCKKDGTDSSATKTHALLKKKTLYKTLASTQAIGMLEYEYDDKGRLVKQIDNGTESPNYFGYFTLSYNEDGTIAKKDVYVSDSKQTSGYSLSKSYDYVYQSGQLDRISSGAEINQLFSYKSNKLISMFQLNGAGIMEKYYYDYDDKGVRIKSSHYRDGIGLIDYQQYRYSNGLLTNEYLNKNGQDSTILYEYSASKIVKITYQNLFKETVRLRQFSLDQNGNVILEICNDYPRGWEDNSYIARFEYYD